MGRLPCARCKKFTSTYSTDFLAPYHFRCLVREWEDYAKRVF